MPNQKYPPVETCREQLPDTPGNRMPLISYFAGIFIRMEYGDAERRLHAEYAEDKAVFGFDGKLLAGEFPAKQQMYVAVWADIRGNDLNTLWELMNREDSHFKLKGLD